MNAEFIKQKAKEYGAAMPVTYLCDMVGHIAQPAWVKKLNPNAILPTYGSVEAAGADLYACLEESVTMIRNGVRTQEYVQFFGWELLDSVDMIKEAFNL